MKLLATTPLEVYQAASLWKIYQDLFQVSIIQTKNPKSSQPCLYSFSEITSSRIFKKCLFETLKHSGRQVEPLITHHAFSGNHQAVMFQLSTPRDVPKHQDVSTCSDYQIIGKHAEIPGRIFLGWILPSIKNSTAPPRKRHPHPLTCGILHLPCLPFSHEPELGNQPQKYPPVPSTTRCEWLDFCQPTGSQTAIGNPQKQLKGTNTEYKNTI